MASFALAAVRPLLGLILTEAQLLRGVRGDVQFISDEMDSIKGFLMKLAGTKEGTGNDHQVRAWMAQVMELAYVSTNCIQDYALCGQARPGDRRGLLGRLQRALRFPKCIVARYRVATRIRRLKIRVLEVSARQQRYAVVMPARKDATSGLAVLQAEAARTGGTNQELLPYPDSDGPRKAPMLAGPGMLLEGTKELTRWLNETAEANGQEWPRVLAILSPDGIKEDGATLPDQLYKKFKSQFNLTARVSIQCPARLSDVILDMRRQLIPDEEVCAPMENGRAGIPQLWPRPVPPSFKGKRLLVVLSGLEYPDDWWGIKMALDTLECSAGSAIVLCTKAKEVAKQCSPTKVLSLVDFYTKKILSLDLANISNLEDKARRHAIKSILNRCNPNIHCMNLFLQTLYQNPYRTEQELKNLYEILDARRSSKLEIRSQMMKFCFHGLPQAYKNCLWYSAIFTRGSYKTRRSSLVRRWVAEALIDKVGRYSAIDEAEHCFDVLSAQKLLLPCDVDGEGKIKCCAVDPLVIGMLKETIRVEDFLDPNLLPPELSLHFSIRNGILLRQFNSIVSKQENTTVDRQMKSIMKFLKLMTASSSFRHLQVLELEGYKGFKKRHLKNICKIHQLRYLNLRNTDISELPTEMDQLLHLETLDIRGTKVQALNTVLPMLKHLLAGHIHFATQTDSTVKSEEFISTLRLPREVTRMESLEKLSYVKVSNSAKELIGISKKLKLKKLGVVLHGKNAKLNDLFIEVDKLNRFLVSLSIRVEVPVGWDVVNDIDLTPPTLLESLHICGVRGLPGWINHLQQLSKITLRDTFLNEDALDIISALRSLSCLRLGYQSFDAAAVSFNDGQFSNLISLVIEDAKLTRITFGSGTAPKLGKMLWSFSRMESLSGVLNLPNLRSLELNGGRCVPDGLRDLQQDITAHHNHVSFKFNPPKDDQRSGTASADTATTS